MIPQGQLACVPARGAPGLQPRGGNGQGQPQQSGQGGAGGPPGRSHTILQSSGKVELMPANQSPIAANQISVDEQSGQRVIRSNGVGKHKTGTFPNQHNPNAISEQSYLYRVPLQPRLAGKSTQVNMMKFGVAVNGVPFEGATAETYQGNRDWHYEAFSGAVPLGLDANRAHVQPGGVYHYHGLPTGLMQELGVSEGKHSPLVGWAADGFPIYTLYGYSNPQQAGTVALMKPSYQLKQGQRSGGDNTPGGTYDGTFGQDYQYVAGVGTLDECNGREAVTPEFPTGTYAYFITNTFPYLPRCFKGTPSADFKPQIPGMMKR